MSFCKIGKCLISAPKRTLAENQLNLTLAENWLNPLIGKWMKADAMAASAHFGTMATTTCFGTVAAIVAAFAYFGNTSLFNLPLA
jgi:hypothetical protein